MEFGSERDIALWDWDFLSLTVSNEVVEDGVAVRDKFSVCFRFPSKG